jgi:putative redox protein
MGMDVLSILQKKQQKVTAFEVQTEGVRAEEHPKVFTEMWVKIIVTGHGVEEKAVERAIELSRDRYCPVSAMLRPTVEIHYSHEIIEAENVAVEGERKR